MLVSGSHPPEVSSISPAWQGGMGGWRGERTLAGNLDVVADADSLAVPQLLALGLAEAGVAVVLEVSHGGGVVRW